MGNSNLTKELYEGYVDIPKGSIDNHKCDYKIMRSGNFIVSVVDKTNYFCDCKCDPGAYATFMVSKSKLNTSITRMTNIIGTDNQNIDISCQKEDNILKIRHINDCTDNDTQFARNYTYQIKVTPL